MRSCLKYPSLLDLHRLPITSVFLSKTRVVSYLLPIYNHSESRDCAIYNIVRYCTPRFVTRVKLLLKNEKYLAYV